MSNIFNEILQYQSDSQQKSSSTFKMEYASMTIVHREVIYKAWK